MTWQIQDKLIYENEEHFLRDEILEYRIRENPQLAPKYSGGFSACWRGYVAKFEITDNYELLLKDVDLIHSEKGDEKEIFLNGLFKDRSKMKLDWLNCIIILYKNLQKGESQFPEQNHYEFYEILEIKNGNLNDFKILDFEGFIEFKKEQYELFLISDDYEIIMQEFIEVNTMYNTREKEYVSKSKWEKWIFNEERFKDYMKNLPQFYIKKIY